MMSEQIWFLVGLLLSSTVLIFVIYYLKRTKICFQYSTLLPTVLFVLLAVIFFIQETVVWVFFAWASCASVLYLVFGFLRLSGRELDEKLVLSLILLVNVAVGIPANIYVFLKSTNWLWKIFSLSIIILIVVPLLTGLIAHSIGKRNLSKKLVQTFYLKKRIRDMPE